MGIVPFKEKLVAKKSSLQVEKGVPSKAWRVQVVTLGTSGEEIGKETIERGSNLLSIEEDYRKAIKSATRDSCQDCNTRLVEVVQVVQQSVITVS